MITGDEYGTGTGSVFLVSSGCQIRLLPASVADAGMV